MRKEKGVTLIALAATVGIMLILISVSVTIAINTGLIGNSESAARNYMSKAEEEEARLQQGKLAMGGSITLEDSVILSETEAGKTLNYKIYGNSVQEGTPTPDTPIEIQSVGDKTKNLLDLSTLKVESDSKYSWKITDTGIKQTNLTEAGYVPKTLFDITDLVEPDTTYYIHRDIEKNFTSKVNTSEMISGRLQIKVDGVELKSMYTNSTNTTVKIPSTFESVTVETYTVDAATKIIDYDSSKSYYWEWKNVYIGKEPYEEYEPYNKYKIPIKINDTTTNIYLDEPLRKIGDYADYIDFETQKVVRKVGKSELSDIALNGKSGASNTNHFYASYNYATNTIKCRPNILLSDSTTLSNKPLVFCEKLPSLSWNDLISSTNIYGISVTESSSKSGNEIRIALPTSIATTASEANIWGTNNDCYVYYVYLDKFIEEEFIDLPKIKTQEKITKLEVLTNIAPSKTELSY